MPIMNHDTRITRSVADLLSRREVAVFVGPDLPSAATGAPGWDELAARLAGRSGLPTGRSWPATAERYVQQSGRRELVDWLDGQLATEAIGPVYRELARLPVDTYISATYDSQLSRALEAHGRPANTIIGEADLNFIRPERPTVVKLLGELGPGGRESLLLTTTDLRRFLQTRSAILEQVVRQAFTNQSLLLLGQDPGTDLFRMLYYWALPQDSPLRRRAFAVWAGMEEWDRESWQQDELAVIDTEPMSFLSAVEAQLAGKLIEPPPVGIDGRERRVVDRPVEPEHGDEEADEGKPDSPIQLAGRTEDGERRQIPPTSASSADSADLAEQLPRIVRTFTLATLALMGGFALLGLVFPGRADTLGLILVALLLTLMLVIVAALLAVRVLSPESGERLFQAILQALPLIGRLAGAPDVEGVEQEPDDSDGPLNSNTA
jgi:hypothetical protein